VNTPMGMGSKHLGRKWKADLHQNHNPCPSAASVPRCLGLSDPQRTSEKEIYLYTESDVSGSGITIVVHCVRLKNSQGQICEYHSYARDRCLIFMGNCVPPMPRCWEATSVETWNPFRIFRRAFLTNFDATCGNSWCAKCLKMWIIS
jgi:hypothetical protein